MRNRPSTTRFRPCALRLLAAVWAVWMAAAGISSGATYSGSYRNPSTILVGTVAAPPGPYPSSIGVTNLPGIVSSVSVILTNFNHTVPDDVDILLVSPGGQKLLMMSDAGGDSATGFIRLTFADDFTPVLPDSTRILTGDYRPTNYGTGDSFSSPAPAAPYGSSFKVFDGINPNGQWRLFVTDDVAGAGSGSIGGWHLNLTTFAAPPVIIAQPQDQAVQPGANVTFNVDVSGPGPFGFQWMRNGQVFIPFGQASSTLRLFNVTSNDAAFYSVIVTNAGNLQGVQSRRARLDILGPLTVVNPPETVVVEPGKDVELFVGATGNPPLRYQWTLNGIPLPGETNALLSLFKLTPDLGGNFQALVWNGDEALTTDPALVLVRPGNPFTAEDKFDARVTIQAPRGVVQGNSSKAGSEFGEPVRPGGGRTVWFEWIAIESGVATFTSRGSTFDTFLSVFTGQQVNNLTPITSDDDRGGFYTSSFQFNAERGQRYQIQLDGLGRNGGGGEFTINWDLEVTQEVVPVVIEEPQPQAVVIGDRAEFRIKVDSEDVQIQWFFNGKAIRGAVENVLVIPNAKSEHVGEYSVRVLNRFNRFVLSPIIPLQIGSIGGFLWGDKQEAILYSLGLGEFVPIGAGDSFYWERPSAANRQASDPNPCGSPFTGTLWRGLEATNNGVIEVTTIGSEIPARMAVYQFSTNAGIISSMQLVCDLSSASNSLPAIAKFDGVQGSNYVVVVEGLEASGTLKLNCQMGVAPALANPLLHYFVPEGSGAVLSMPATNWNPLPSTQWRLNGIDIPGATNPTLTLSHFNALGEGTYSVFVSNFVRSATRDVALVSLVGPFTVNHWWSTNSGKIGFVLSTSNSMPFVLESSTNLNGSWTPIATNPNPFNVLFYTDENPVATPHRFFRAAPWPPLAP